MKFFRVLSCHDEANLVFPVSYETGSVSYDAGSCCRAMNKYSLFTKLSENVIYRHISASFFCFLLRVTKIQPQSSSDEGCGAMAGWLLRRVRGMRQAARDYRTLRAQAKLETLCPLLSHHEYGRPPGST